MVDGALITQSDVVAATTLAGINLALDGGPAQAPPQPGAVLQRLIEQRLIQREIRNYPGVEVSSEDVRAQLQVLEEKYRPQGGLAVMAAQWNTSMEAIEGEVHYQLRMNGFLEVRFRSFIRISDEEIALFYSDRLPEMLKKSGLDTIPPLEAVKQQIRDTLTEIRLQEELDRWIQDLVRKADIQLFGENYSLVPKDRMNTPYSGKDVPGPRTP